MNTRPLEDAYDELRSAVALRGFATPDDGWDVDTILAHVAANDRLLRIVTQALVAGRAPRYDNAPAIDESGLGIVADAAGGFDGLVAHVEEESAALVAAARRLTSAQEATSVVTRIVDGGRVRIDGPVPWGDALRAHAAVHLRSHAAQIRALAKEDAP